MTSLIKVIKMKRVHVEPWSTKEKLCLASAVLHSGDQNWMSVSRILRMYGEPNRPLDWYSQKQCAVQYECLLSNAGTPKRKKRNEKGVESVDIPEEAIVRKLTQERIEELKMLIAEDKADYLRVKKLQEEVDSGKLDESLDDVGLQMEEEIRKDKEKQSMNQFEVRKTDTGALSSRITGQDADVNESNLDVDMKPSLTPTSPLLTSLLQSPSPSLLLRNSSTPTISSLLHSSPSIPRVHDSPTLSKLLESPSAQPSAVQVKPETHVKDITVESNVVESKEKETTNQDESGTTDIISEVKAEEDVSDSAVLEKKPNVVRKLDLEVSPQSLEKEEQSSLNHTQDSDTLEEQLETEIELDSQAVDMIVMGPNQSAVIAVHHDTSNEHLDEEGIGMIKEEMSSHNEILKEEQCEEVTEETIVLMNEEEMSKPVEDALKMINDATIIVAEPEQVVEIETPVIEDIHDDATNTEVVTDSEVKDIVAEEKVVMEEVVMEEIKEDSVEDVQYEKSDTEINAEEIVIEEIKHDVIEEEVLASEGNAEIEVNIENVTGTGTLSDANDKLDRIEEEKKELKEKKTEDVEYEVNVTTIENRPKKVGRRRKSSKDVKEKESIRVKETVASTSPPVILPKENLSTSPIEEPVSAQPEKESLPSVLSPKKQKETPISAKQIEVPVSPPKESISPVVSSTQQEETTESQISKKEKESSSSSNELVTTSLPEKEQTPSTPLSLPPPENVISDFKVPRSDTPSTTDEDNEPIAYIAKRGKHKRNSGVDSKPNSPSPQSFDEGSKEFRAWKKSILLVYNRLSTHKYASIFLRPITNERARGYHTVIHRPMDLSTLKKNLESGVIRTTVEFQRDVMLMFQNAIMYNNTNTGIFEMASVMQRECIQHFQLMVEAMGEGVPWRESAMNNEKTTRTRLKNEDLPPSRKRAHNSMSEDSKIIIPAKRKKLTTN